MAPKRPPYPPNPPFNYSPLTPKEANMKRLREFLDPEAAAVNQYHQRTGQLPSVIGATPLRGAEGGIAGTRFTPVNRPTGRAQRGGHLPPGVNVARAKNAGRAPAANPQGRGGLGPGMGRRRRGGAQQPLTPAGLPPDIVLRQPGKEPRKQLKRYGEFVSSGPAPSLPPPPAPLVRPGVPPPSYSELMHRRGMDSRGPGWLKISIIFKGNLPDVLYDGFDASTGYNPSPWSGPEEEKREFERVREESLRGVHFSRWNLSWMIRMAQLKGLDILELDEGESNFRHELEGRLLVVKKDEAKVAKKAAEKGTDGGQWAKFQGEEREVRTHIWLWEQTDELEVIKEKVSLALEKNGQPRVFIDAGEISLWLSAITWGKKPSRMARFAGRNSEIDDGYWLGVYAYRMPAEEAGRELLLRDENDLRMGR